MGKGSRNRQLHQQDKIENPKKYVKKKQPKPMPTWAKRTIAIVIVLALVIGVAAYIIVDTGAVQRNRVLIKSETGKFDVNQQMASFIAWQALYSNAAMYWTYCDYGIYEDEYGITDPETGFESADQYALVAAQSGMENQLRDSIDDVMQTLLECVALCDAASVAKVTLGEEEEASVQAAIDSLNQLRSGYMFSSLGDFLSTAIAKGLNESDVRDALELMELADKYSTQMKLSFEKGTTLADLEAFRNANPGTFFKTDYLTYAANDQEFADELLDCTTPEEFKEAILLYHFNKNYKTAYNKFTVQETVSEDLAALSNKTNDNGGTALTEALTTLGAEIKTITPEGAGLDESLKSWLFVTKRTKNETASIPAKDESGMYIVAFLSEAASTTSVEAGVKYYEFKDGVSHDGNDDFKDTILTYIKESKQDSPEYPEVDYKNGKDKATAFETELKAVITDETARKALLESKNAVMDKTIASTSGASDIPEYLRDSIFAELADYKAGDTMIVENGAMAYLVYFSAIDTTTATVCYVTLEGDVYYQVIHDITSSLNSVYPTKKDQGFVSEPKEDSFEEWINERTDSEGYTSARAEGDVKYFATTTDGKTTYQVYMVINEPLYLETETAVYGGYYLFSGTDAEKQADAAIAALEGKEGAELIGAFTAINASATTSAALKSSAVTDTNLNKWFFTEEKDNNTVGKISSASGSSFYVAVFVEASPAWQATAKDGFVTEAHTTWVESLMEKYEPNEKALAKLGKPTPETSGTETGSGSAETTGA